MKIIDEIYNWDGQLGKRGKTEYIILHHRAGDGTAQSIHQQHISNGWLGIGYHFYIRKDGRVYRGRPLNAWGSHCVEYNNKSIGICFEGNFESETMPDAQIRAGKALINHIKTLYPTAQIKAHRDLYATACPGKLFPFDELLKGDVGMSLEEAIEIVQAKAGLEDETIEFMLCYKYGEQLLTKLAEAMI